MTDGKSVGRLGERTNSRARCLVVVYLVRKSSHWSGCEGRKWAGTSSGQCQFFCTSKVSHSGVQNQSRPARFHPSIHELVTRLDPGGSPTCGGGLRNASFGLYGQLVARWWGGCGVQTDVLRSPPTRGARVTWHSSWGGNRFLGASGTLEIA